jgi:uncharacterized protein YceH (UPF0502 family)
MGVLVEKAKTTPENYPLSLNAIMVGCNQKSNRAPQMSLSADDVEATLDRLREIGVVIEVQGSGRVPKYKHLMYEWLGVDKVELAVMAELLLRGEQTVGELRGRAARMEPIPDLNSLRPILQSLVEKGLVVELTPEGRGQTVTHALYEPRELAELRERFASGAPVPASSPRSTSSPTSSSPGSSSPGSSSPIDADELTALKDEVAALRDELAEFRDRLEQIERLTS